MSYHIMSHHVTSYHVISRHVMLCRHYQMLEHGHIGYGSDQIPLLVVNGRVSGGGYTVIIGRIRDMECTHIIM